MVSRNTPPRLGRGLAALLGETGMQPSGGQQNLIVALPVDLIDANPFQPRMDFRQEDLESLADSIRVQGVLQPILVRRHPTEGDRFQIVAGERRFRAAMLAGLTEIPAMQREMEDSDAAVVALVENLQRQDLNPLEEAEGFQRLLDEFGLTHEALGYAVSKSRAHVGNTIRLLRLSDPIKKEIRNGTLSSGHARALLNAPNPDALAEQVVKRGLSVRQTETLVAKAIAARGAKPRPVSNKPDLADLERQLTNVLGCRVTITTTRKGGGEISVQFRDSYQLDEIISRLMRQPEHASADGEA